MFSFRKLFGFGEKQAPTKPTEQSPQIPSKSVGTRESRRQPDSNVGTSNVDTTRNSSSSSDLLDPLSPLSPISPLNPLSPIWHSSSASAAPQDCGPASTPDTGNSFSSSSNTCDTGSSYGGGSSYDSGSSSSGSYDSGSSSSGSFDGGSSSGSFITNDPQHDFRMPRLSI